jgi:hypothetical protein
MRTARRQPDQTELEGLRASAALWGQDASRKNSAICLDPPPGEPIALRDKLA